MGRRYAVAGNATTGSGGKTLASLSSSTTVRPRVYDIILGSDATPADVALKFFVQRCTTQGTTTAFTPVALDSGDPASTTASGITHSSEPGYTSNAIILDIAMNQRSTQRWVAAPGGEIVCPATSLNGVGVYVVHASATPTVRCTVHFEE